MEHTPGPWGLGYGHQSNCFGIYTKKMLDNQLCQSPICNVSPIERVDEQDRANAKLIAAAPDLLYALKKLKEWVGKLEDLRGDDPPCALVDNAIKKATA